MVEKQFRSQNDAKPILIQDSGTPTKTKASSKSKLDNRPVNAIKEMDEYLASQQMAFDQLKLQFPNELI